MPSLSQILETVFYSLVNFLPWMIIALYPFRNMLRFSKKTTIILIGLITVVQVWLGFMAKFIVEDNVNLLSALSTIIYGVFYFATIKANFGKTLFTLLMVSNIANFVVMSSKCLEGIIFKGLASQNYRWSFTLITTIIDIIICIPLFIYLKKEYSKAMEQKEKIYQWRYLWLVPATFYLLWYHNTYYNSLSALEIALKPSNAIFLFLINLGAFFVYNIVVQTVNSYSTNLILQAQNHQLTMQSLQYENLCERINEARRENHDFRHHMALLSGYIDNNDFNSIKGYINSFLSNTPEDSSISFCEHYALNMLLAYYSSISKQSEIDYSIDINVPKSINISDSDLSVLLGNLLENAIDACLEQKNTKGIIIVRGSIEGSNLILTIDNSFENDIRKDYDGKYLSTKINGKGIGIESARAIVERYKGTMRIEQKENIFYVSIIMKLER